MNSKPTKTIILDARSVVLILSWVTIILTVLHVVILCIYYWIDDEEQFDFVRLVDMDYEGNIPTLFSALLFFIAALLFWTLGKWEGKTAQAGNFQKSNRTGWFGLAIVFGFLGVDEGAKIHEYVGDFMERFIEAEGFLYFPWIIPYIAIFLVLVVLYLPFFFRLSVETRIGMAISAVLFLFGAVVLDSFGGWEADRNGTSSMLYSIFYTLEEVLEMSGLIVLIKTLIDALVRRGFVLRSETAEVP